jgi:hypothetical protein
MVVQETIGRGGTNFNLSSNDLGISTARDNRAANIDNKFGAMNVTHQMSKKWSLVRLGNFFK